MRFLFYGVFVKLNNRRRDKISTATCGGICRTIAPTNDFSLRCRCFLANGYSAGQ